jgi:hypothetical protein
MMDPTVELDQLLAALLDGPPDPACHRRINHLLRTHPELQQDYLDVLQLHGLLHWRAGHAVPQEPPTINIAPPKRLARAPRRWIQRAALAASILLLVVGLGAWWLWPAPESGHAPDAVERLVDWNLQLAELPAPAQRDAVYQREVVEIKAMLASAGLGPEDHDLTQALLDNGAWLTRHHDPLDAADRFNDIAEKVVARMDAATTAQDPQRVVKLAYVYTRLTDLGIDGNLDRALETGSLNAEQKGKLKQLVHKDAARARKLADILERNPDASLTAIRHAMKNHSHKPKHRSSR